MKFYYFYKITNLINNKFYYGVHSTNNLEDGYMGSGIALNKAYKKYGINNFVKEILYFFQSQEQMYSFEQSYVNQSVVKNQMCYNLVIGGKSKKTYKSLSDLSKEKQDDSFRQKIKEGMYRYWTTGDIQQKRRKISEKNKHYWTTGNVQEKKKKHSECLKRSYFNNPKRREEIIKRLNQRWNGINGELNRKKLSESLKNSIKKREADKRIKDSKMYVLYNNPDFKKRWKKVYEQDMEIICELIIHSNLPEAFIIYNLFNKKVHVDRVMAYYKYIGALPKEKFIQKKSRFLKLQNSVNKGHKDGCSKKTFFSDQIKYSFYFMYKDFFDQLKILVEIVNNDKISDSMVTNLQEYVKIIPNYFQIIEYFQQLGIISNVETILIRTDKTVCNRNFTVPAKKTKFQINYKNLKNYLIDQEFNIYGIDDNGNPVSKGKFELEFNGKKYSLRCVRKKYQD